MNNLLKALILIAFSMFKFSATARQIKLNYNPKGFIVVVYIDSMKVYTDTTSLFKLIDKTQENSERSRKLVLGLIESSNNDTISFNGAVRFNDNIDDKYFPIENLTKQLILSNKAKLFDKSGRRVNTIISKRIKTVTSNSKHIIRIYSNKDTKEKLFYKRIYFSIS